MTRLGSTFDQLLPEGGTPLPMRRRRRDDGGELDITPMIDIVFLLLIFFLVASIPEMNAQAKLPPARHGVGINPRRSVIITVAETSDPRRGEVYLADGVEGQPMPVEPAAQAAAIEQAVQGNAGYRLPDDIDAQERIIRQAVRFGAERLGFTDVLLKAERGVVHREVARVAEAVGSAGVDAVQLNIAVLEEE
jgi:biopolymer transport protein ExbD